MRIQKFPLFSQSAHGFQEFGHIPRSLFTLCNLTIVLTDPQCSFLVSFRIWSQQRRHLQLGIEKKYSRNPYHTVRPQWDTNCLSESRGGSWFSDVISALRYWSEQNLMNWAETTVFVEACKPCGSRACSGFALCHSVGESVTVAILLYCCIELRPRSADFNRTIIHIGMPLRLRLQTPACIMPVSLRLDSSACYPSPCDSLGLLTFWASGFTGR